ncbi:DUF2147 domain-containing protein [Formosa sediminum]|uniref:DUF2147 domain-containing protein n=1 Tax=Formosa sediminum TaxID=2594004 RepID=A0A516GT51_9FLAO|nr:DUF2147 domain-containing protein [Formosa sediminum]QDO94560.1 DUF2147 domain-containing protein [Formosa sediminum]
MKQLCALLLITISITTNAQSIIGQWETYDDKTNEKKALIEISKTNDTYSAKIIDKYVGDMDSVCEKCEGDKKNKPIIGLVIIEDIKKDDDEYNDGTILDPESGDVYSCYLKLVNTDKLKVRGFLGVSLFGRTQYWLRKK